MPRATDARWHSILPGNGRQEQLGSITINLEVIQSCATEGIIRVIINQTCSISFAMGEHLFMDEAATLPRFHSHTSNNTKTPCLLQYVQYLQPETLATSAARCLIISMTAALRRESDCCCILRRCSFKSLQRGTWHSDSLHARACN